MTKAKRNALPRRNGTINRLNTEQLWMLDLGDDLFNDGILADPSDYAQAWEIYQRDHLAAYIAEHPGRRPHAWWKMLAPEPRRFHRGGSTKSIDTGKPLYFGAPCCVVLAPEGEGEIYETELEYLTRLNLLEPGEAEAAAVLASKDAGR